MSKSRKEIGVCVSAVLCKEANDKIKKCKDKTPLWECEKVEESTKLSDDLGLDSLDKVIISMELENILNVQIRYDSESSWYTAGDIIDCLEDMC